MPVIERDFFNRNACLVARDLLGAYLVREIDGQRIVGRIVETEAYTGDDEASHGRPGQTPRNKPMWGEPGFAYVYFTYGMHWLLNVACEPAGQAAAVLLRGLEPVEGLDIIAANRIGIKQKDWTNGPARLTKAFGVDKTQNGVDMTQANVGLWFEQGDFVPDNQVMMGPRIGLGKNVSEKWVLMPWRWWIKDHPDVSR